MFTNYTNFGNAAQPCVWQHTKTVDCDKNDGPGICWQRRWVGNVSNNVYKTSNGLFCPKLSSSGFGNCYWQNNLFVVDTNLFSFLSRTEYQYGLLHRTVDTDVPLEGYMLPNQWNSSNKDLYSIICLWRTQSNPDSPRNEAWSWLAKLPWELATVTHGYVHLLEKWFPISFEPLISLPRLGRLCPITNMSCCYHLSPIMWAGILKKSEREWERQDKKSYLSTKVSFSVSLRSCLAACLNLLFYLDPTVLLHQCFKWMSSSWERNIYIQRVQGHW